jgi:predicted nucleic-acid-binding Zn-ribbon protein
VCSEVKMKSIEKEIESRFVCTKCRSSGANVKSLAMTGTGISRFLDIQHNRYVFASCNHCGYTEVYNLDTLSGGKDDVGTILDVMFR